MTRRRTPFAARLAATVAAAMAAAACEGDVRTVRTGAPDSAGNRHVVQAADHAGRPVFCLRIDGDVADVSRMDVFGGRSDFVVLTGMAGGEDQCRVLVYSEAGALLASHRVRGTTPFAAGGLDTRLAAEPLRQLQFPIAGAVRAVVVAGRTFLAVPTGGMWFPHAVELLDTRGGRLTCRATLWNRGSFAYLAEDGRRLAVLGLNNSFQAPGAATYPVGVAVMDLSGLADEGPEITAVVPGAQDAGRGYAWYFLLPEDHGAGTSQILRPVLDGDVLRCPMERGVTYVCDLRDGAVSATADAAFRRAFDARRAAGAATEGVDDHLRALAARVRVFRP